MRAGKRGQRGCNQLKINALPKSPEGLCKREHDFRRKCGKERPHTPGNGDGCQNKGVAGKAIRKSMKTKGEQIWLLPRRWVKREHSRTGGGNTRYWGKAKSDGTAWIWAGV